MQARNLLPIPMFNRNIIVLFITYAISWCVMALAFSATASVGQYLAVDKDLALLPLIMQVFGAVSMTAPAASMMKKFGRRRVFMLGSCIGVIGALMCAYSIYLQNFWLLVCCTPFLGMFNGFGELARFAAAEIFPDEKQKNRAVAVVVSGGIVSAFIGPAIASTSNQAFDSVAPYFGPYLAAFALCLLSLGCYAALHNLPRTESQSNNQSETAVAKWQVIKNPIFIVATATTSLGYLVMSAMMDAMPITMLQSSLDFSDTTFVLQWHMLAMFAPSYLTARLMDKCGTTPVIFGGILLNTIGVISAMQGVQLHHFWVGLFMIGLGWNLMYLGGTQLLTRLPETLRSQAEGLNNLAVMSSFAFSAPLAALILATLGWQAINYFALIMLLLAVALKLKFNTSPQQKIPIAGSSL